MTMLRRIVEIPSPTGAEDELAAYLVDTARGLGFRAHRDAAGNAVAEVGERTGPAVMLLGHLDTVPGTLPVREIDGVLHGRGAVDAKAPLATMLWAAARVAKHAAYRVVVVGAVGEEGDSPGALHLLRGERPDALVIGEPSGLDTVVIGYKGIVRLRLTVTRPRAHTSSPAPKAVEVAADFWHDLRAHLAAQGAGESPFGRPIPALTGLTGDPMHAVLTASCRTPVGFDSRAFVDWLRERAGEDDLAILEDVPAVRSSRRDPVVSSLAAAIRTHVGPPRTKVKLGTSDMNVVAPVWSVPVAAYGPGDAALDHTDAERVELAEYLRAIDVLAQALDGIALAVGRRGTHLTSVKR